MTLTLKCPACAEEWTVEVRSTMGVQICPNLSCPKRAADLAQPWVANAIELERRELREALETLVKYHEGPPGLVPLEALKAANAALRRG